MPGMGGRMSTVIKAKINKLLDKAEDPSETLEYSYAKQMELLQNVKKGIADVVTAKKRLQMQSSGLEQSVVKLDTQAREALAAGNEELARRALERRNVAQTELQSLDQQVAELEGQLAAGPHLLLQAPDPALVGRHQGADGARRAAEAAGPLGDEAGVVVDVPVEPAGREGLGPAVRRLDVFVGDFLEVEGRGREQQVVRVRGEVGDGGEPLGRAQVLHHLHAHDEVVAPAQGLQD